MPPKKSAKTQPSTAPFVKVLQDVRASYGDGGEAELFYPLYSCADLPGVDKAAISAGLRDIAARRNDLQQNSVVEDIVDPDLYPRLLTEAERTAARTNAFVGTRDGSTRHELINAAHRGSYTWIPTSVAVDIKSGTAKFTSPVHGLPRNERTAPLIDAIEGVFQAMLPGLLAVLPPVLPKVLQVAIKAQRYRVPPRATYTGQWHTEGVTEDVAAVGVYYAEWPSELTGGELKFRPSELPDDSYRHHVEKYVAENGGGLSALVPATEGSAVVFSNTLPHRFKTLVNDSDHELYRAFLNFFVINPAKPLPTTNEVPTNADVYLSLVRRLNYDVVGDILSFLRLTPTTWPEAKQLRARAKAEMSERRGRWGQINYGNCGTVHWLATDPRAPPRGSSDKKAAAELKYEDFDDDDAYRAARYGLYGGEARAYMGDRELGIRNHAKSSSGGVASLVEGP